MLFASFVKAEGIYDSWFNKCVSYMTSGGSFCHSEFIFRWTPEQLEQVLARVKGFASLRSMSKIGDHVDVAVYILWGGHVQYRILRGYGEFWSFPEGGNVVHINTSWENELNTIGWLSNQIGSSYDHMGALLYSMPLRRPNNTYNSYFCSQLMACALQRLGYFQHLNPASLTPNGLYAVLKNT